METTSVDDVVALVENLRVDQSSGLPARHQPIVLLWAVGRAAAGQPRLARWSDCRADLKRLLRSYGRPDSSPSPEYPFVALSRSGLWRLHDVSEEVPQARGSGLRKWLDDHDPRGGLTERFYELMATDEEARARVVAPLLNRFFDFEMKPVLVEDLHLNGPAFNGFGHVPGISVGQWFHNRKAAAKALVHRPIQGGICGTAAGGAESIVVSGGYEDDEDHGDVIIYTGQGGRNQDTGQQVADQTLTRGNAALVTSLAMGTPVRVIRGSEGDPAYSPTEGYRYDGLFRVEDHWSEIGKSSFRIWRYRLTRIPDPDHIAWHHPRPAVLPRQPEGRVAPTRVTTSTQRIVRNTAVAEYVKRVHAHTCQVCGLRLVTPTGGYAEAAHIRGLGRPHSGPDVADNVLCLCPNHHVLFDFGMLIIEDDLTVIDRTAGSDLGRLRVSEPHEIGRQYLAYHRNHHAGQDAARDGARPV
ncbi:YDG/SRA domain-containing protein [Kitasatospora sp. NPDC054939]